jgi:hypothetical protein
VSSVCCCVYVGWLGVFGGGAVSKGRPPRGSPPPPPSPSAPPRLPCAAFDSVKHGDVDLLAPKLIYVAINMLGLAMGLYKLGTCVGMGVTLRCPCLCPRVVFAMVTLVEGPRLSRHARARPHPRAPVGSLFRALLVSCPARVCVCVLLPRVRRRCWLGAHRCRAAIPSSAGWTVAPVSALCTACAY